MKLAYKPFAIVVGLLAGILSRKAVQKIWNRASSDEPADPEDRDATWGEVLMAAGVSGAVMGIVQAAVRRGGAEAFNRATGYWPE
jgi:hypothetical protein